MKACYGIFLLFLCSAGCADDGMQASGSGLLGSWVSDPAYLHASSYASLQFNPDGTFKSGFTVLGAPNRGYYELKGQILTLYDAPKEEAKHVATLPVYLEGDRLVLHPFLRAHGSHGITGHWSLRTRATGEGEQVDDYEIAADGRALWRVTQDNRRLMELSGFFHEKSPGYFESTFERPADSGNSGKVTFTNIFYLLNDRTLVEANSVFKRAGS